MSTWKAVAGTGLAAAVLVLAGARAGAMRIGAETQGGGLSPAYLDQLLAPVALHPDQLLAQILLCSGNSSKVGELGAWLKQNARLKGSELQQAAQKAGFEPSFVALAPFPQVVDLMAGNLAWTSQIGGAFAVDRGAVFDSIQRLRKQSQAAGNLKSTPQQTVETRTTQGGEQVIVIEPANPQVVYVPQYDPQVVYTQPATTHTTVVVKEDSHEEEAAVAGAVIGFAAGIAIGAAINDSHYYGPYGWRGGAYMYNDGWDDWYDDREDAREDFYENREDAREDWQDHREDMAGERSERTSDAREQRGGRTTAAQAQRTERQEARGTPEAQAQRDERRTEAQGRAQEARSTGAERTSAERSGTRSDAFSNYSSGRSTREASSRGERSRGSSGERRSRRK
ncbi:MAG TPA: DUF3300 domain-containing protein [Vicinamibacteria bacterium]|nr:DUF3300 domain-containing protein [Vicinamibacteria bacterium]